MKTIFQKDAKILRQVAKEVRIGDIRSAKIKRVLREMSAALKSQLDGVAIAAPQIGYPLRIFVVSGRVFKGDFNERELPSDDLPDETLAKKKKTPKDMVFINPKISRLSRDKDWLPEGCLSVRPIYGRTLRSKKATVTAYDEEGKKFQRGASGLLAQIFQHETDHLDGILFIDHAKELREESLP